MINSLYKDSHITQSLYHSKKMIEPRECSGRRASQNSVKEYSSATVNNSIVTNIRKPAEISFRGFSSSRLANTNSFKNLIDVTREFMGGSPEHKKLINLVNETVDCMINKKTIIGEEVKTYLERHKQTLQQMIDESTAILNDENKKDPLDADGMREGLKKTVNTALDVYPTLEHPGRIYRNKIIKNLFLMAEHSQAVFDALFALLLAGVFRPAAIMLTPADKKNIDDKKYAAAHSIASGIIGYGISLLISLPISKAIEKIGKEPDIYLNKKSLEYLRHTRAFKAAQKHINILHTAILAPPRAMITVALIPLILKHVFGWEKKKDVKKDNIKSTQNFTINSANDKTKEVFKGFVGGTK